MLKSEIICAGLILLAWPAAPGAAQEWVPVPPHRLPAGTVIEGFSRPAQKTGFHRGEWISGYWVKVPENAAWVPGHYNRYGRWVEGTFLAD